MPSTGAINSQGLVWGQNNKWMFVPGISDSPKYNQSLAQQQQQSLAQASAQAAQAAQDQRTARLNSLYSTAVGRVGSAFAPYTQQFYTGLETKYLAPRLSQLDKQRGQADSEVLFTLARQGIGSSSAAGNLRDRIAGIYSEESDRLKKEASDFVNRSRESIDSQRSIAMRLASNAQGNEQELTRLAGSPVSVVAPNEPKAEPTLADVFAGRLRSSSSSLNAGGRYGGDAAGANLTGNSGAAPSPSFGGGASPIFRSPVRGQGKSFFAR